MRRSTVLFAAVAAMPALSPTAVSAQSFDGARVIQSAQLSDLKAVVTSLGHTIDAEGVSGEHSLRVITEDGLRYLLIGTACNVGDVAGCQGVMMQVRFTIDNGEEILVENVNRANYEQAAINAWFNEDSRMMGITRYVVLDHGITLANLKSNVDVLLAITPMVMDVVRDR
jgi:hypothetical protein